MAKALLSQIYNLLWLLLAPLALCYFLLRSLKAPAYRQHLSERFGLVTIPPSQQGGLIIHAVSMGEVIAATPVIEADVNGEAGDRPRLNIRYDPAALTAGAIIAAAAETGFHIADISTSEPDLEDVFLTLTQDA